MPQARALCRAFNQSRNVRHHKAVVFIHANHAQIGMQRGKRIIRHFRACGGYSANQRGFARVGHAQQPHICQHFQFQQQSACFAFLARGELLGRAVHRRFEMDIAQAAFATFCHAHALPVVGEIGNDFIGVHIANQRANGHAQFNVVCACAVAIGAMPFFAIFGLIAFHKAVFHQRVHIFIGNGKHAAAASAIAAIGPAAWHKFFTTETGCAVASASAKDFYFGFIYKFHESSSRVLGCFRQPENGFQAA